MVGYLARRKANRWGAHPCFRVPHKEECHRQLLQTVPLTEPVEGTSQLLCLHSSSSSCTIVWNQSRPRGTLKGIWHRKMKGKEGWYWTKTCVLKYGRVTLPWELWCLHPGSEINGVVMLGLVMITNTARYCVLACRNQSLATTHQAAIPLLSWSSNHDSLSALVSLSNFVQKLLLRNCPCVLWYNFFFTCGNVNTHLGPPLWLPLPYCLPFFNFF